MYSEHKVFVCRYAYTPLSLKVREGRLRPDLLWSHLKVHISLNIYDTLIYDIPKNRGVSHLSTDVRHINRYILIFERTGHQK